MSRGFWPIGEAAQADYEALREAVVSGQRLETLAAERFEHRGLAGLITWPEVERLFKAVLCGAQRPPWTPHVDPRVDALAAGYALIVGAAPDAERVRRVYG